MFRTSTIKPSNRSFRQTCLHVKILHSDQHLHVAGSITHKVLNWLTVKVSVVLALLITCYTVRVLYVQQHVRH